MSLKNSSISDSMKVYEDIGLQSRSLSSKPESLHGKIHEIDFIGNGTCQVSQLNLLFNRSIELTRDAQANLSARGLHHRRVEVFKKDVSNTTEIIRSFSKVDNKRSSKHVTSAPAHLFGVYFQRAVGYERVGRIEDAIKDYSICIQIDPKHAVSYYNRGCIYQLKANRESNNDSTKKSYINLALADFNQALFNDPSNIVYRQNRYMTLRSAGDYIEAVNDIMLCKAMKYDTTISDELKEGKDVHIDSDTLIPVTISIDPIIYSLRLPIAKRNKENLTPVVDFLSLSKFFRKFQQNSNLLLQIAYQLLVVTYKKGEVVFEEGDSGKTFYIILGGEISIVKLKTYRKTNMKENLTLVKLYRGDAFGENALDGDGIRSAGAIATQYTQLLILDQKQYKFVMAHYRESLKQDVLSIFAHMPLFDTWSEENLHELARSAIKEQYGPNCIILREGDPCKFMYVIKQGMVTITKQIEKPVPPKLSYNDILNPEVLQEAELPGLWVLESSWDDHNHQNHNDANYKQTIASSASISTPHQYEEFNCGLLVSGQYFCETAVLTQGAPSPTAVTTTTAVEVFKFSGELLQKLRIKYDRNSVKLLNASHALFNPNPEKLKYYYQNKFIWEAKRQKIVESLPVRSPHALPSIFDAGKNDVYKQKPMKFKGGHS